MTSFITLHKLTLKNFKGIKNFTFEPNGQNMKIFGDNATGKTTLYDAFLWILFDKDSSNRKNFTIKPLDSTGNEQHGLEHTVEAILQINGNPLILKKTYQEKWTKKRGSAEKQFTGHKTLYWVDDVPVKAGEYQKQINTIISEDIFKLITNPMYFNTYLSWQDRRELLLEIAGDISDEEVIASNSALSRLTDILNGKSTDDYKKILHERIKKINDEIAKIPIRIDELNSTLAGEDVDYSGIEIELTQRKDELAEIEKQMLSANAIVEQCLAQQKRLGKLYHTLNLKKAELEQETNAGHNALAEESRQLKNTIAEIENEFGILESRFKVTSDEKQNLVTKMDELRKKWVEINAETFTEPEADSLICPTCGQDLPAVQREAKINTARETFNNSKTARLNKITAEGKSLKGKVQELEDKLVGNQQRIREKTNAHKKAQSQLEELQAKLNAPREIQNVEQHPEYQQIQQQIAQIEAEIQSPPEDTTTTLLSQKQAVSAKIERLNAILNNREVRERTLKRIAELKGQERTLAQQIANLEGQRHLIEQFIITKVNLLESAINNRFRTVTFKMFLVQINEGVKECCETLINGVPFADANNGAKINAGLDIIDTLTKHYGVSTPVFIDNMEAITKPLQIDSQVIGLIVSETDKQLRVEG